MKYLFWFLLVSPCLLFAEDVYLKNGKVYKNILPNIQADTYIVFWYITDHSRESIIVERKDLDKIDSSNKYNELENSRIEYVSKLVEKAEKEAQIRQENFASYNFSLIGYAGNIPNVYLGLSFFKVRSEALSFFLSIKFSPVGIPDDQIYDGISYNKAANIYGDWKNETKTLYMNFDVGLVSQLSRSVLFFYGLGYAASREYLGFKDAYEILGKNGQYYIPSDYKGSINFTGGICFLAEDGWYFQIGGDSTPVGVELGIGKRF